MITIPPPTLLSSFSLQPTGPLLKYSPDSAAPAISSFTNFDVLAQRTNELIGMAPRGPAVMAFESRRMTADCFAGGEMIVRGGRLMMSSHGVPVHADEMSAPDKPSARKHNSTKPLPVTNDMIALALFQTGGNREEAAEVLGIKPVTVRQRIRRAPEGSLLHELSKSWKKGLGVSFTEEDLLKALKKYKGYRGETAEKLGIGRSFLKKLIDGSTNPEVQYYQTFTGLTEGNRPIVDRKEVSDREIASAIEECGGNVATAAEDLGRDWANIYRRIRNANDYSPLKPLQKEHGYGPAKRYPLSDVVKALDESNGDIATAARKLGMGYSSLYHRIKGAKPESPLFRFKSKQK